MLGGEIFVLPAVAAQMTGPSLWFAYLAAALLVLPAAFSQAELATAMPESGGAYLYIERAMGPLVGTIAGVGLWLSLLLKSTFALVVLEGYLALLLDAPKTVPALGLIVLVIGLNVLGVRKVGRVQTIVVAVCFCALVALVVLGVRFDPPQAQAAGAWMRNGTSGLLAATGLVFVSYAGVTKIAAVAEEVRSPARNIPRGILISLIGMAALYTAVAAILATVFPLAQLEGDATPIASLASLVGGPIGKTTIAVTAVLALLAMANAGLLAASRFPFAMGRHRLVPAPLQRVSPRFSTPVLAIIVTGTAMAVMLLSLDVIRIAKLASAFMIASFVAVNVAVLILRESEAHWYKPPFLSPMYPYIQLGGIATGLVILVSMGMLALVGLTIAVVAGGLLYIVYGRRVTRLGVFKQMAPRADLLAGQTTDRQTASFPAARARTVVTLFGKEPSPEALVHLGMTLSADEKLDVLVLRDVPEQTDLSDIASEPDDRVESLERRVTGLGQERGMTTRLDLVLTRDVRQTVFDYVRQQELGWVIMAWRDRTMRGLIVRNPMKWLTEHMPCNLALFKDAGIRTYRKIMVLAEPGPHDALVTRTADDLAGLFHAELTFVRFLHDDAPEQRVEDIGRYQTELHGLCHRPATSELVRGRDRVRSLVHATARFDLMVLGAPAERPLQSLLVPTPEEAITEQAHCAVLRLRAPRAVAHSSVVSAPATAEMSGTSMRRSILVPAATRARVQVTKKEQIFTMLGAMLAPAFRSASATEIYDALWLRERVQNTGMGQGVAIPHATLPNAKRTKLALMTLQEPIEYGSLGKVDIIFCLVGPPSDRESHLRLLSTIATMIVQNDLSATLRACKDDAAAENALMRSAAEVLDKA